jgi:hypothetical protein
MSSLPPKPYSLVGIVTERHSECQKPIQKTIHNRQNCH